MRALVLLALLVPAVACSQGKPVPLAGGASGSSAAGPRIVPLSGTATATGSARPR